MYFGEDHLAGRKKFKFWNCNLVLQKSTIFHKKYYSKIFFKFLSYEVFSTWFYDSQLPTLIPPNSYTVKYNFFLQILVRLVRFKKNFEQKQQQNLTSVVIVIDLINCKNAFKKLLNKLFCKIKKKMNRANWANPRRRKNKKVL